MKIVNLICLYLILIWLLT